MCHKFADIGLKKEIIFAIIAVSSNLLHNGKFTGLYYNLYASRI